MCIRQNIGKFNAWTCKSETKKFSDIFRCDTTQCDIISRFQPHSQLVYDLLHTFIKILFQLSKMPAALWQGLWLFWLHWLENISFRKTSPIHLCLLTQKYTNLDLIFWEHFIIPDICNFFYTDRIFGFQILHQKTQPQIAKYASFCVQSEKNYTWLNLFTRTWRPWQISGMHFIWCIFEARGVQYMLSLLDGVN